MLELCEKHSVCGEPHLGRPVINGHLPYIFQLDPHSQKRWLYYLYAEDELEREGIEVDRRDPGGTEVVFPESTAFRRLYSCLAEVQEDVLGFLENCQSGVLDLLWLKKHLGMMLDEHMEIATTGNKWRPVIRPNMSSLPLEFGAYMRKREILFPVFSGKGEMFSKIKKCDNCQALYVPKSRKRRFCGDKCKNEYHYRVAH